VTVTDTLPTAGGLSWSIDAANSAAGCTIAAGALTCDFGDMTATSKSVHVVGSTSTANCGQISNTAHMSSTNDGTAQASASVTVTCPVQPDARIRRPGGHVRGNNIYNSTADNQTVRLKARAGGKRVAWISIQNDGGVADAFKVAASASSAPGFSIRYLVDLTDVTAAVENGTFQTLTVAPGAIYRLRVVVKYSADAAAGSSITRLITFTSVVDGGKSDTVGYYAKRL
jgi:hypothetical protein